MPVVDPGQLPPSTDLLTTTQAAAALGVSINTLRRYVHCDWIKPAAVVGRSLFFSRPDVEALRHRLKR